MLVCVSKFSNVEFAIERNNKVINLPVVIHMIYVLHEFYRCLLIYPKIIV